MLDKKHKEVNREQTLLALLEKVDGVRPNAKGSCIKHRTMSANPFRFFRGSAQVFYHDIYNNNLGIPQDLTHALPNTMVMGDCHLSNFGFFTEEGSHNETVIFGPNDFDDACIGSCLWDLIRFSSSLSLTADFCQGVASGRYKPEEEYSDNRYAVSGTDAREAISQFFLSYIAACKQLHEGHLKRKFVAKRFEENDALYPLWKKAKKRAVGGKHFSTKSALAKAIEWPSGYPKFKKLPKKFIPLNTSEYKEVAFALAPYVDDTILDIVQRIGAGTGSVNMERYYLLVGPSNVNINVIDNLALCHIVEVKKQREAAPLAYFKSLSPVNQLTPAHLTVACKRRMQRRPDLVLDDIDWRNQHFLIRSRHHAKVGISPENIGFTVSSDTGKSMVEYAQICGKTLALAHCRADRRSTRFEEAVFTQIPTYLDTLICSSITYAEQVKIDWEIMVKLVNSKSGKIF